IKVLRQRFAQDPRFLERFRQEAQAAANLSHPNIVTIYDIGSDDGMPPAGETWHYIVMEYVEGRNLKDWIRESAPFPIASAVEIALQICAGVGHAHRHGLVHCDLKPQNILITQGGMVKVTDFGIARAYATITPEETDSVWGTPHYFAPEQAAGESPTPASDVYSIGVILYEMLTGRLPFQAKDARTLALMHLQEPPPPLHPFNPQVPPQLEQIVLRALSKEPAARYRTAEQFQRILRRYREEGEGVTSYYAPVSPEAYPQAPVPVVGAEGEAPVGYAQPYEYEEQVAEPYAVAGGPDWLAWFLSVVAILMILGLIPLWAVVYRSYQALGQPPLPTPTPRPTATAPP
ncbi:MAG: serine/threonine protein kinase, partial [Chloroflexi bacterium]